MAQRRKGLKALRFKGQHLPYLPIRFFFNLSMTFVSRYATVPLSR